MCLCESCISDRNKWMVHRIWEAEVPDRRSVNWNIRLTTNKRLTTRRHDASRSNAIISNHDKERSYKTFLLIQTLKIPDFTSSIMRRNILRVKAYQVNTSKYTNSKAYGRSRFNVAFTFPRNFVMFMNTLFLYSVRLLPSPLDQ